MIDRILSALGYMTAREALAAGCTHHGSYFGIPVWIGSDDCPMVAAKWAPMEYVMEAMHWIEGAAHSLLFPDEPHGFRFCIGKQIEVEVSA